jgi:plasmid stability protein
LHGKHYDPEAGRGVKAKLRVRAATNGQSMEEEARAILAAGVDTRLAPTTGLGQAIRRRIAPLGGVHLDLPKREAIRRPPGFRK